MQPADRQPITSPVQIIAPLKSIFRSVTERSGEKNRFQFVRSLSISLSLYARMYIYFRLSEFRGPFDPDTIYKKRIYKTPHLTVAPLRWSKHARCVLGTRVEQRSVFRGRNLNISRPMARHPRALQPSENSFRSVSAFAGREI